LPADRRVRKELRRHLKLDNNAELWVTLYGVKRLLLEDDDLDFMQWLISKADGKNFVSLVRLYEFELSRGRRDLNLLQDRVDRCALGISVRYQDDNRLSYNTQATIPAFQLDGVCQLRDIWFEPSSEEKGVWIDPAIISLVIEAQKAGNAA